MSGQPDFEGIRSNSIFGQRIDQGTVHCASFRSASAHQARELFAKRGEISEAIFDLGEPPFGDLARRERRIALLRRPSTAHLRRRASAGFPSSVDRIRTGVIAERLE